jgi:hypothetical protein
MLKKKNLGQFSKNYRTFYPKKLSLISQKYVFGIRDPRSRIRDPEKIYSGSRILIQGSKRHRIPYPGSGSATLEKYVPFLVAVFQIRIGLDPDSIASTCSLNGLHVSWIRIRKN